MMIRDKRTSIDITPNIDDLNRVSISYNYDTTGKPRFTIASSYSYENMGADLDLQCAKDIIQTLSEFIRLHEPEYKAPVIEKKVASDRDIDL